MSRDPIHELGGENLYALVANNCLNNIDVIGLQGAEFKYELDRAIHFGCSYCTNRCSPNSPPRIDGIESIILPANFSSPEAVKDYEKYIAGLDGLNLVSGVTPSSVLMTTIEMSYSLALPNLRDTFAIAVEAFGKNTAFVRLRTRIQYSTCELKRCLFYWNRYEWVTHPDSPTGWREHTSGMTDPEMGYFGFQDAQGHVLEAQQAHANEFTRRYVN